MNSFTGNSYQFSRNSDYKQHISQIFYEVVLRHFPTCGKPARFQKPATLPADENLDKNTSACLFSRLQHIPD